MNSLSLTEQTNDLAYRLPALIGRTITVFVDSGGISGNGFTGTLAEILTDSIRLITALPSAPRKNYTKKKQTPSLGTCTIIMKEHITAITYSII